jgi:NitT/TauT family transport system substrate-binding protein
MNRVKILALAATLLVPFGATAQELTTVNVIMPLPRSANFFPLITGEALGYFAEEGVEVNLLPSSTSIPYVAFVQNGQSDLSMLDHSEVINAAAADANIAVVFEVMQNAPEGLAVLADSQYQKVEDLKGTTVGLVSDRDRNTLAIALGTVGLSIDDVSTVVVGEGGPVQANALSSGSVSAISGAVPDWLALQAHGMKIRMITPEDVTRVPANNFVINVDRVDPDATAAMAKAAVPEEWENDVFGRQFLDASIPMNVSLTENYGDIQTKVWADIQPRMLAVGAIEQEIDPSKFLNNSFIAYANDWSRDEVAAEVKAWRDANMK